MPQSPIEDKPFVVDQITLVCNGCRSERTFHLAEPLRSADAIINWMKTKAVACGCGALTCDVKAWIADQN